jgi:hypothetical protein
MGGSQLASGGGETFLRFLHCALGGAVGGAELCLACAGFLGSGEHYSGAGHGRLTGRVGREGGEQISPVLRRPAPRFSSIERHGRGIESAIRQRHLRQRCERHADGLGEPAARERHRPVAFARGKFSRFSVMRACAASSGETSPAFT